MMTSWKLKVRLEPQGNLWCLTDLEAELGAENVKEVLGNYLSEDAVAVWDLLLNEPGLTGSESTEFLEATEAMEVDQPVMLFWTSQIPDPRLQKHPKPQELGDRRVHQSQGSPSKTGMTLRKREATSHLK